MRRARVRVEVRVRFHQSGALAHSSNRAHCVGTMAS